MTPTAAPAPAAAPVPSRGTRRGAPARAGSSRQICPRSPTALLAYPMHGQRKLLGEGYRTRDGHLVEWLGAHLAEQGGVTVVSRPEPPLPRRSPRGTAAAGTRSVEPVGWRLPHLRDRRRWWPDSVTAYPEVPAHLDSTPALVWNPFVATAPAHADPFVGRRRVVLDLLDDWTQHYAFRSIRAEVHEAYAAAFARADVVTANGAGTAELARRFGRDDVVLLPNGCDPERYDPSSTAVGPTTVGYVGKIGRRLDLEGILATVRRHPSVRFVFAGPVLDAEYRAPLQGAENVTLLGDVHYDDVPALLRTFDVGWVPHHVGEREVGGDVIKTYEYRAAGLPVLSTPVCGARSRGLDGVVVAPLADHADRLAELVARGTRVPRQRPAIPADATWRHKADIVLRALALR
jgi:glycosyltransferase involved in cell wall biosynthesis